MPTDMMVMTVAEVASNELAAVVSTTSPMAAPPPMETATMEPVEGSTKSPAMPPMVTPAKVVTVPLLAAGVTGPTSSASVCGEAQAPASPAAPHSSTAE